MYTHRFCVKLTDSQISQIRIIYTSSHRFQNLWEMCCVKKISAKNQSKKITLFFDVAKRPTFPQPPGDVTIQTLDSKNNVSVHSVQGNLSIECLNTGHDFGDNVIEISKEFIKIFDEEESHRYFGRQLCTSVSDRINIEFQNRSRATWAFTKQIKAYWTTTYLYGYDWRCLRQVLVWHCYLGLRYYPWRSMICKNYI